MTDANLEKMQKRLLISRVFTPTAPIDEADLFSGRLSEIQRVLDTVGQKGQHAIIYGERGVGKTSLTNVLKAMLNFPSNKVIVARATSDNSDTYSSVWRKVFSEIPYVSQGQTAGFSPQQTIMVQSLADHLPADIDQNLVRRVLTQLGANNVVIITIDEFDRLDAEASTAIADTVKTLSDHATPATLILVGVADSVTQLITEHESIERALVQIHMPRMSREEIGEIVTRGLALLEMSISEDALKRIILLSQGLPHFTHLLALYATQHAFDNDQGEVDVPSVEFAIRKAVENTQMSIKATYNKAVSSPRPDNLYAAVLLACALANTDELAYFQPSSVKEPMSDLMNKKYEIPSFARHLKDFVDLSRGPILDRTGTERKYRYRFKNPLMQPYVIMRGIAEGRLSRERLDTYYRTGH